MEGIFTKDGQGVWQPQGTVQYSRTNSKSCHHLGLRRQGDKAVTRLLRERVTYQEPRPSERDTAGPGQTLGVGIRAINTQLAPFLSCEPCRGSQWPHAGQSAREPSDTSQSCGARSMLEGVTVDLEEQRHAAHEA